MFGTSIHFFPKQVLPVMGSYFILLLALAVSGCLVPLFSCFMAPVVSSCLCLLRWLPLVASGCPGRLWLLGLLFFSGCLRPCWVLWPACVGMLFLLLSWAVHGSWVHVLKLAGFTYEAHEGFWCLRNGGMDGSPVALLSIQLCWFAGPQGLRHLFMCLVLHVLFNSFGLRGRFLFPAWGVCAGRKMGDAIEWRGAPF